MGASAMEDTAGRAADAVLTDKQERHKYRKTYNGSTYPPQNQSLLYATHQLTYKIGIVAPKAHQSGKVKSASSPNSVNTIQNIFFSIPAGRGFLPTF